MKDPISGWKAEHDNFSLLLDVFQREVDRFHMGERPDYELMLDIVTYLRYFPERTHHPREDVAFKRMMEKDPSLEATINRLLQEHRVISAAGAQIQDLLEQVVSDAIVERSLLEAAASTFLVYYRHHISAEDQGIMPLAAKLLTPEDWAEVGRAVSSVPDTLFGAQVDARYRELREKIESEMAA
jgi:hemerythrin-like domain-containing protein